MKIEVTCPNCKNPISILRKHVNATILCRKCAHSLVPAEELRRARETRALKMKALPLYRRWTFWALLGNLAAVVAIAIASPYLGAPYENLGPPEELAISCLGAIALAQEIHKERYGSYTSLENLGIIELIDQSIARATSVDNTKAGYFFLLLLDYPNSWCAVARPANPGKECSRSFYVDETGVVRCESSEDEGCPLAGKSSPTLEEWKERIRSD